VPSLEPRSVDVRSGTFAIDDVPPGDYVVQAVSRYLIDPLTVRRMSENPIEIGVTDVSVAAGASVEAVIRTARSSAVAGRVVSRDGEPVPPGLRIVALPADPDAFPHTRSASVETDGAFHITDLFGRVRLALYSPPRGWRIESAFIAGVNAADEPAPFGRSDHSRPDVQVVIAKGGAEISGRVVGLAAGAASVVLAYPTDPRLWFDQSRYFALAAADRNGRFTVALLPQGEYWVAAVDAASVDTKAVEWQNPEVLTRLTPGATRVMLTDGGRATADVRISK
jgi:hypothetical protein